MEETRLFGAPVTWFEQSQVWGDSIRVRARRRTIDTVFVRGSAFAAQRDSTLDRIQQLTGQNLTAIFRADSLRRITAGPTARAIRFLKTDTGTLKGAAQTSGDRIVLRFRGGSVWRTSILGGVESTYYRTPESVPSPFHLDGFQWTPERRPAKAGLLRGRWEEARLDGHSAPARPDSVAVPPDAEQVPPSRPDSSSSALSQSPSTSP